ncbi:MAG: hypothetical protein Q4B08_05980 [Propionibacteriaceae bacterium]|nr:hypothetical protein [Propionibacteriaceae bacterium]
MILICAGLGAVLLGAGLVGAALWATRQQPVAPPTATSETAALGSSVTPQASPSAQGTPPPATGPGVNDGLAVASRFGLACEQEPTEQLRSYACGGRFGDTEMVLYIGATADGQLRQLSLRKDSERGDKDWQPVWQELGRVLLGKKYLEDYAATMSGARAELGDSLGPLTRQYGDIGLRTNGRTYLVLQAKAWTPAGLTQPGLGISLDAVARAADNAEYACERSTETGGEVLGCWRQDGNWVHTVGWDAGQLVFTTYSADPNGTEIPLDQHPGVAAIPKLADAIASPSLDVSAAVKQTPMGTLRFMGPLLVRSSYGDPPENTLTVEVGLSCWAEARTNC